MFISLLVHPIPAGQRWCSENKFLMIIPDLLHHLLDRYSVGPKHLRSPAPDEKALEMMVSAALRAPDHGGLTPFRFAVIRDDAKNRLADLFEQAAVRSGKSPSEASRDRSRAMDPPLTIAVVARIDPGHPLAPAHEQWICLGGALTNLLNAAHALGYGAKVLSGSKVRDAEIKAAFCRPGEVLVGWVVMGTKAREGALKFRKSSPSGLIENWV